MNNLISRKGFFSLLNNLMCFMLQSFFVVEGEGGGTEPTSIVPEGDTSIEQRGDTSPDQETGKAEKPGWTSGLKADYQDNEYLTSKKTVSELAEDAISMKTKLENSVFIPGEDATDEERAAYRERMGIPASGDDYQFDDGLENNEFLKWFRTEAHSKGLSNDQAKELVSSFNQHVGSELARQQEAHINGLTNSLKKEWGDSFDNRITRANNLAKRYGGEDIKINDIQTIKLLDNMAELISEDSHGGGSGGAGGGSKKREKGELTFSKSLS